MNRRSLCALVGGRGGGSVPDRGGRKARAQAGEEAGGRRAAASGTATAQTSAPSGQRNASSSRSGSGSGRGMPTGWTATTTGSRASRCRRVSRRICARG